MGAVNILKLAELWNTLDLILSVFDTTAVILSLNLLKLLEVVEFYLLGCNAV
jgi:hypothetical protein